LRTWQEHNAHLVRWRGQVRIPSAAHEYMLYQSLLGAWPLTGIDRTFVERIEAYALKAAREGKEQTSWLAPDPDYEQGLTDFIRGMGKREEGFFIILNIDQVLSSDEMVSIQAAKAAPTPKVAA